MIQIPDIFQIEFIPSCIEDPVAASGVKSPVFSFPGLLNILDHPCIRVHQVRAQTAQLVEMTDAAALSPVVGVGGIFRAEHGAMTHLFDGCPIVTAVAGDTGRMRGRGMLNAPVARFAGRCLPVHEGAARKKNQRKQRQGEKVTKHRFFHSLSTGMVFPLHRHSISNIPPLANPFIEALR